MNLEEAVKAAVDEAIKSNINETKVKIEEFFNDYKDDLCKLNIYKDNKFIKQIKLPIELSIIEPTKNNLIVQLYCSNQLDYLLLEIANSGVAFLREEFKRYLNSNYKTNFNKEDDLYVEPTYRVDIFYKKVLELSTND